MRKTWLYLTGAAAVCAIFAAMALLRGGKEPAPGDDGDSRGRNAEATARPSSADDTASAVQVEDAANEPRQEERRVNKRALGLRNPSDKTFFDDPDHPFSEEDKAVAIALQYILDEKAEALSKGADDPAAYEAARAQLLKAAARAAASGNPAVRGCAVEAYSWLGGDALAEVTPMMADRDAEVAEAAIDVVEKALEEQDNAQLRFEAAIEYMSTFSANEDALTMLSGISEGSALELIDAAGDTAAAQAKAADNRQLVVSLIGERLIDSPNELCSRHGQELYSDITGEPWVSAHDAMLWAQDPDSYVAPEEP